MSNVNSFEAFYNLPTLSVTTGSATPITVPATGIATLPSPALPVGSNISLGISDAVVGNMTVDGHPFKVRISGKVFTGASSTFIPAIYLGTASTVGSSVASVTGTAFAGASNFTLEATLIWDSVSGKLNGYALASINGANSAIATTSVQSGITSATALSFVPQFTFGTANAANTVTVTEFVIDRA